MLDFGVRSTDPSATKQAVAIPVFFTWSTPWDLGTAHLSIKAAPFVGVMEQAPGLDSTRPYNPYAMAGIRTYASVWFSWFLGNGFNLSIGEGAQIGFSNDLTKAIGRGFTACWTAVPGAASAASGSTITRRSTD